LEEAVVKQEMKQNEMENETGATLKILILLSKIIITPSMKSYVVAAEVL